ncbi:MAG: FtsW/RodA/SpoVE family cell cycle protein, partial [Phycisphaeraceae bacterium]|nr:FtsW/RodA/SpoVE family cell cycle protein [Phycisphaeraceae bacterium]
MRRSFSAHPGWLALTASVVLAVVGINAIATVSEGFAARQTMWLVVGLVALAICLVPRPRLLQDLSYPLFAFSICLLVFVILPFVPRWLVPVRNGATAWINLGVMAFQPSELTKIAFVMAMAEYLRHRESYRTVRGLLTPFILLLVPVFLILKEPDLGTALLFPPALLVMLVAAGAKLRHMLALVGLGLVAVVVNVAIIYVMPDSL